MEVFGVLGPEARAAIPQLTRLAQTSSDPERADRCIQVLIQMAWCPGSRIAANFINPRNWLAVRRGDFEP